MDARDLPPVEDLTRITKKLVGGISDEEIRRGVLPQDVKAYFKSMMKMVNDYVYDQVVNLRKPVDEVMAQCVAHMHGFIKAGDHFTALAFSQALAAPVLQDALNRQLQQQPEVMRFRQSYTPTIDPQQDYNNGYRLFENNGEPVDRATKAAREKIVVPYVHHFTTMGDRVNTKINQNDRRAKEASLQGHHAVVEGANEAIRDGEIALMSLVRTFAEYRNRIAKSLQVDPEFTNQIRLTNRQVNLLMSMTAETGERLNRQAGYLKEAFREYLQNKDKAGADVKMFFAVANYMEEKLGADFGRLQAYAKKYARITDMLCDRKKLPYLSPAKLNEFCNALPPDEKDVMSSLLGIVSKFNPETLRQSGNFDEQVNVLLDQINQLLAGYQNALQKEDLKKIGEVISGRERNSSMVDRLRMSRSGSGSTPAASRKGSDASPTSSYVDTESSGSKSKSKSKKSGLEAMRRDSASFFASRRDSKAPPLVTKADRVRGFIADLNEKLQLGDFNIVVLADNIKTSWTAVGPAESMPEPIQEMVKLFEKFMEKHADRDYYDLNSVGLENMAERDELVELYNEAILRLKEFAADSDIVDMQFPFHLRSDTSLLGTLQNDILKFKAGYSTENDMERFIIGLLKDVTASKLSNAEKLQALDIIDRAFSDYIVKQQSQSLANTILEIQQTAMIALEREGREAKERDKFAKRHEASIRNAERMQVQEELKAENQGWKRAARTNNTRQNESAESPELVVGKVRAAVKKTSAVESASEVVKEPGTPKVKPALPPKPLKKADTHSAAGVMQTLAKGDADEAVKDARKAEKKTNIDDVAERAAGMTRQLTDSGLMPRRRERVVRPPVVDQPRQPDKEGAEEQQQTRSPSMRKGSSDKSE